MCAVMHARKIAWKALPWSFTMSHTDTTSDCGECRGKALQAIACVIGLPRAALRFPPVTYIGKRCVLPSRQGFALRHSFFALHYSFFVIPVCDILELGFILVYVNQIPFYPFTFLLFYFSKYSWYSEDLCSFKTGSKGVVWDIFRLPLRRCGFSSYEGRDMYHSIEKPID